MKYIISLLICIIAANAVHAQSTDSIKLTSTEKSALLSKSRLQKTVGIIIIVTGTPVVIVTAYPLAIVSKNDLDKSALTGVFIGSALYSLLSIP